MCDTNDYLPYNFRGCTLQGIFGPWENCVAIMNENGESFRIVPIANADHATGKEVPTINVSSSIVKRKFDAADQSTFCKEVDFYYS